MNCIQGLITSYTLDLQEVLGVGIAVPGPINAQKGILRGVGKKRGSENQQYLAPFDWREIPLKETIQNEFGVNVFADNCANVSALAESWFGNGVGVNNFVLYSIGMGVGTGVIIDGMLYRGEDDVVAEIGYITVDLNGSRCIWGNIGYLELYASFSNIVEEYRNITKKIKEKGDETFLREVERLFSMVYRGDNVAFQLIKKRAEILGIGAVSLANIFGPECIIVASNDLGNVDLSLIVDELQESVKNRMFSVIADKVKVIQSKLGNDIHLYGGVALLLQDFFQMLPTEVLSGKAVASQKEGG